MNLVALVILVALILDVALHMAADILNLRELKGDLPPAFKGIYDPERYRRSQAYLRVNTRFGWAAALFNLSLVLGFWFAGGFAWLDASVRSLGRGPVLSGLIFIGALLLARAVLNQPFAVYATFVIEERFGFNRTSRRTYLGDLFKGLVLAGVLGGPLLAGILAFFGAAGPKAWLLCWAVVTLYLLAVQYVAPSWIMPLFNRFSPLEEGELKSAIFAYARSIRFPLANVLVMDGSKRSTRSNAFFTGFGRNKRIVLFDTLVARHTVAELVAVLAHEMGHYRKRHIQQAMFLGIAQAGILFYLLSLTLSQQALYDAFFVPQPSVYAGLVFFALLYTPLDFGLGLTGLALSRRNETAADRFSVETYHRPGAMSEALKKLSAHNLSNLRPHPFYVFLNYSHPPVLKRLEAIERLEADTETGRTGAAGRER